MKQIKKRASIATTDAIKAFESAYRAFVNSEEANVKDSLLDDRVSIDDLEKSLSFEIRVSNDAQASIVLDKETFEATIIVSLSGKESQEAHSEALKLAKIIEESFKHALGPQGFQGGQGAKRLEGSFSDAWVYDKDT